MQADERNIAQSEKLRDPWIAEIVSFELPSREREDYSNSRRVLSGTATMKREAIPKGQFTELSCPLQSSREMLGPRDVSASSRKAVLRDIENCETAMRSLHQSRAVFPFGRSNGINSCRSPSPFDI
jgi:hypothetical protein